MLEKARGYYTAVATSDCRGVLGMKIDSRQNFKK